MLRVPLALPALLLAALLAPGLAAAACPPDDCVAVGTDERPARASLVAVSTSGDAEGGVVAVSHSGNARGAAAASVFGDAAGHTLAASALGDASGATLTASGAGDATACPRPSCTGVAGRGDATGYRAASVFGNATSCDEGIFTPTVPDFLLGPCVSVSLFDDARGGWVVSGTGHGSGRFGILSTFSGCDLSTTWVGIFHRQAAALACTDPEPLLP